MICLKKGKLFRNKWNSNYFLCNTKSVRLGLIDQKYLSIGQKAFYGTCEKYQLEVDGKLVLDGIFIMTGLGEISEQDDSFEYYMSEKIVKNDAKGVVPLIMVYTEILREKS